MDRRHRVYTLSIKLYKKYDYLYSLMVSERHSKDLIQKDLNRLSQRKRLAINAILSVDPSYFSREFTSFTHNFEQTCTPKDRLVPEWYKKKFLKQFDL